MCTVCVYFVILCNVYGRMSLNGIQSTKSVKINVHFGYLSGWLFHKIYFCSYLQKSGAGIIFSRPYFSNGRAVICSFVYSSWMYCG